MRRRLAAFLLAPLAAIALPAAKPLPPGDAPAPPAGEAWRSQGVPVCVARLRAVRAFTPDDLETICGCTFDSYLESHGTNPLPGLENDHLPVAVEQQLLDCTARTRPDQRETVRQLGAIWPAGSPMVAPPPLTEAPPADAKPAGAGDDSPVADANGGESGGGFWDWVSALTLPAWLTGASVLWWVALGIFLFGLLILKVRRRDPRNDLMGPPSSMRRGAPPRPPRRPDLPR
jgi:hypothetical protein